MKVAHGDRANTQLVFHQSPGEPAGIEVIDASVGRWSRASPAHITDQRSCLWCKSALHPRRPAAQKWVWWRWLSPPMLHPSLSVIHSLFIWLCGDSLTFTPRADGLTQWLPRMLRRSRRWSCLHPPPQLHWQFSRDHLYHLMSAAAAAAAAVCRQRTDAWEKLRFWRKEFQLSFTGKETFTISGFELLAWLNINCRCFKNCTFTVSDVCAVTATEMSRFKLKLSIHVFTECDNSSFY